MEEINLNDGAANFTNLAKKLIAILESDISLVFDNKRKLIAAINGMKEIAFEDNSQNSTPAKYLVFPNVTASLTCVQFLKTNAPKKIYENIKQDGQYAKFSIEKDGDEATNFFKECLGLKAELLTILQNVKTKKNSALANFIEKLVKSLSQRSLYTPNSGFPTKMPEEETSVFGSAAYKAVIRQFNAILDRAVIISPDLEIISITNKSYLENSSNEVAKELAILFTQLKQFGIIVPYKFKVTQQGINITSSDYLKLRLFSTEKLTAIHSLYYLLNKGEIFFYCDTFDTENHYFFLPTESDKSYYAYYFKLVKDHLKKIYGEILKEFFLNNKYICCQPASEENFSSYLLIHKTLYTQIVDAYQQSDFCEISTEIKLIEKNLVVETETKSDEEDLAPPAM